MNRSIGVVVMAAVLAFAIVPASRAAVVSLPVADGYLFGGPVDTGGFSDQFAFSLLKDSVVDGGVLDYFVNNLSLSFKTVSAAAWTPVTVDISTPTTTFFSLGASALGAGDYLFRIAGNGFGSIPFRGYTGYLNVAPVPEPETWAMLTVGSLLVAYQLRRKQKNLSQPPLAA